MTVAYTQYFSPKRAHLLSHLFFLFAQSTFDAQTKVTFVLWWKLAKLFDIMTGGILFSVAKILAVWVLCSY